MSASERAYAAADAWRALSNAAEEALAGSRSAADALTSNNSGAAVDAFAGKWRALGGSNGPLPRLVEQCAELAERCEQYAARLATMSPEGFDGLDVLGGLHGLDGLATPSYRRVGQSFRPE